MSNTREPTYKTFIINRFHCGCVYQTPRDTAVFCPVHWASPESSFLTGTESIQIPLDKGLFSPRLPANRRPGHDAPFPLENSAHNSLHTTTSLTDGNDNEWASPELEDVGICCACYIDNGVIRETGIAACECGDKYCSYRWCGELEGLHAFWRLHVQRHSEKETGTPEEDIFSHGPHTGLPENVRRVLNAEREQIEIALAHAATEMTVARVMARPSAGPYHRYQPIYLIPWLEKEARTILKPDPKEIPWARVSLRRKLTRLIVAGAIRPTVNNRTPTHS